MINFEYFIPTKIYFGKGQIERLKEIKKYGGKILFIYGGGSIKENGVYDSVMKILKDNNLKVFELSGVQANPRIDLVRAGVEVCRKEGIDAVLGAGGGSVIDTAKAVAAGALYDGDVWDLIKDGSRIEGALPIFTILTMAATGSEMDFFSVISDMTTNDKLGTFSNYLFPTVSILDPEYTYSVPRRQTVAGTADIMSHLIETYFNEYDEALVPESMCEGLLKVCIKYLPVVLEHPDNYEARANLMWTSSLAINGILKCGCNTPWSVHKMEHELSAYFDVVHGEGLAILTPHWMDHILSDKTVGRFMKYAVNIWGLSDQGDPMELAKASIQKTREFFQSIGLPETLKSVGVKQDKLDIMAEKASKYLTNTYVPLTKDDVLSIFQMAY